MSKLVPSWLVGNRDAADASAFIADLADRLRYRVQLTTDGHKPYLQTVEDAFGADMDYAMLIKLYGSDPEAGRFSPPVVLAKEDYMYYNFGRVHRSLRNPYPRTPAMAAGVADHVWTCEEIAALLD